MRWQGYNGQQASFSRRIDVRQVGHALLHLDKFDEDYLITLPTLHIEGLWAGSPYVELNGNSYIQSSTGYTSKIDYSGKGWLSGKKNSFAATLFPQGKEREVLYSVDGQWTGDFAIRDAKTKAGVDSWSARANKTTPLKVAPVEQQDELESQRAWKKVAEALNKGDMNATSTHKSTIENSQRELRKKEQTEGREWERVFFTRCKDDPLFGKLGGPLGEKVESEKTNGIWRFDTSKADKAASPYRPGTMPR